MAKPFDRLDCAELQRYIHHQNVICSEKLLEALKASHPELDPDAKPEPVALVVLPPIPNEAIADAAEIVFPSWVNQVKRIQKAVCDEFGITLHDMLSARRSRQIVRPRQVAMYLCKTLTGKSLPEIGRRFGHRDHTTALAAIRRVEKICAVDEAFLSRVEKLADTMGAQVS